ncbi:pyridine nucleotide-disulfide oxidoreductase family protein [Clostridium argentinense CDC 2741]|uniref:Pyridine nucleotide-disulfide oxidoreductase family protein n=1 Tax=Clostridium argentinense CDC 2741 TaxID=1418104 RepID=A0A0C1R3E5_9CLOT|nr:FAD-dependent oxidoreductase [Clostridium argentinense]ARC85195.1 FAD-dependent oxidoreductase [Clostridium argentinense]KIE48042.1 pyridine nucleotide-disulfide oxidoreductase family protein [Clostridium argentinense CDC 2741]NFF39502.1 FAD-dependent oxidoreductase [Clostridium argentinense]NFP50951.1 FAD-dependent oxidoreductase [Clostridium argentinense]NFP73655.1 FAD-dependent oxidoreductase [Clostridium argentinense]
MKVVVIGGGWSGCAAAISAKKAGAEVTLIEKTDLLLGLGNVGGIMRNNGRYTAAEELIALGAGDLIHITDKNSRHKNIDFPGHKHAWLYDVNKIEPEVRKHLLDLGIEIKLVTRAVDVEREGNKLKGIYISDGSFIEGDVFIETTGSTGPMGNCLRYGNGCSMCILRCPAFGPRISISHRAGIEDIKGERDEDVYGAFSGSCKLAKETLSKEIIEELDEKGVVVLTVPVEDINLDKLTQKVCQQYALKEFAENIVLLDTGHAKLMTSYYPLEKLRKIKGLESAKFLDPYAGGKGNSIRYLSVAPRTDDLKVMGLDNLFCGGEKSGLFVGHTEAISTGSIAGHNAVRNYLGIPLLILPRNLAIGDIIAYANEKVQTKEGRRNRYTFAGAGYFKRMQETGLYSTDNQEIHNRVKKVNLDNIFNEKLI